MGKLSNILRYKEDSQKSKEQMDIEKQNIILSRIVPFEIEGLDYNGLCERAKALHQVIWNLEANCYDYQQKFERQNYDMMELAERARQMNRGRRKTPTGHTGLGGSVFPYRTKLCDRPAQDFSVLQIRTAKGQKNLRRTSSHLPRPRRRQGQRSPR